MVSHDEPFSVLIPEHYRKSRGIRYFLAFSNVRESVVTRVDRYIAINPKMLFAEGDSCVRAFPRVFEIFRDRDRVRSNRLCTCAPKYGVGVVHCRNTRGIASIICSTPACSRSSHLIHSAGSATAGTCRPGRQQRNQQHSIYYAHNYPPYVVCQSTCLSVPKLSPRSQAYK